MSGPNWVHVETTVKLAVMENVVTAMLVKRGVALAVGERTVTAAV